jgi:hypothetical protein
MQTRRAYATIESQVWRLRERIRSEEADPYKRVRKMHATYSVLSKAIDGRAAAEEMDHVDAAVQQLAREWVQVFAQAPPHVHKEVKRILYACFVQYAVNSVGGRLPANRHTRRCSNKRKSRRQKHRRMGKHVWRKPRPWQQTR